MKSVQNTAKSMKLLPPLWYITIYTVCNHVYRSYLSVSYKLTSKMVLFCRCLCNSKSTVVVFGYKFFQALLRGLDILLSLIPYSPCPQRTEMIWSA